MGVLVTRGSGVCVKYVMHESLCLVLTKIKCVIVLYQRKSLAYVQRF